MKLSSVRLCWVPVTWRSAFASMGFLGAVALERRAMALPRLVMRMDSPAAARSASSLRWALAFAKLTVVSDIPHSPDHVDGQSYLGATVREIGWREGRAADAGLAADCFGESGLCQQSGCPRSGFLPSYVNKVGVPEVDSCLRRGRVKKVGVPEGRVSQKWIPAKWVSQRIDYPTIRNVGVPEGLDFAAPGWSKAFFPSGWSVRDFT